MNGVVSLKRSPNRCVWPKCESRSRVELLIDPSPTYPVGVELCIEHREFINTLFFLMRLEAQRDQKRLTD
jgi:hypothetical protein